MIWFRVSQYVRDQTTDCLLTIVSFFSVTGRPNDGDKRLLVKIKLPDHMIHDDTDERTDQSVIGVCFIARSIGWLELDRKMQLVFQVNLYLGVWRHEVTGCNANFLFILSFFSSHSTCCFLEFLSNDFPSILPRSFVILYSKLQSRRSDSGNRRGTPGLAPMWIHYRKCG